MINVNGKTYNGNNVSIVNGVVTVNGKRVDEEKENNKKIYITIEGSFGNLDVNECETLSIKGDIKGDVDVGAGNVDITGDVKGDVDVGAGNVNCGNVGGDVDTNAGNISRK